MKCKRLEILQKVFSKFLFWNVNDFFRVCLKKDVRTSWLIIINNFSKLGRIGWGTYYYKKGSKYVGEFKNNKFNGYGTYFGKVGNEIYYTYVGEWFDDRHHGKGTKTNRYGDKYIGYWKDGKRHGQGTQTWACGKKYVGGWKEGFMDGQGTEFFKNGDKLEGKRKTLWGLSKGTYTWGTYKHKEVDGKMTYIVEDGDKYIGEFGPGSQRLPHGQGTYILKSGEKYVGEFNTGKFNNGQLTVKAMARSCYLDRSDIRWE